MLLAGHPVAARPCASATVRSRRPTVVVRATATLKTPSNATGADELGALSQVSSVVPDSLGFGSGVSLKAATSSATSLRAVITSESLAFKPYENAITAALSYDRCRALPKKSDRVSCVLDKALVNVGALLLPQVDGGRICTEVDPRLAHDTAKMVAKVHHLLELYKEVGVAKARLIFRLPATWEGTQAAKALEAEGTAVQLFLVYSLVQGVAGMQAGASVLQPNVGRVRDWYGQHPGVIRNPKGPREDSGATSGVDPGLELVEALYCYAHKYHPKTKIMAGGIRTRADALALAGCDYLVLSERVMGALAGHDSSQGYNDGLHAADGEEGLTPRLSAAAAAAANVGKLETLSEASWRAGLGMAGEELLKRGLDSQVSEVRELLAELENRAGGTE